MIWQPIETAPKGTPVLVYQPKSEFSDAHMSVMHYDYGWMTTAVSGYEWDEEITRPTHWMPLPEAPQP